eukprot:TRINITY_DN6974_c0_g1_i5.p1 TRINITY_DN6974_c0_g1~~TRINITY_DN6974_c0_g1_i5.p1  ORF type:complete len:388 (+),score=160.73 TRINITY_DN6974_c0_g1_i5:61-1164(+)
MSLMLLTPTKLGDFTAKNRLALAPLTRGRATEDSVPTDVMVEYYKQRSNAGLVITEATGISKQGLGWWRAPGIWSDEQVAGWQQVTQAIHDEDSLACMQLWHMGRQAHSDVTGEPIVAPSPIAVPGEVTTVNHVKKPYEVPEELTVEKIKRIQEDYKRAAENAKRAGFDMIEVHSANGYLLDEFLQSVTNKRTDEYGGSVENRLRMLREVLDAVESVFPLRNVGVRLSPNGAFGAMGSEDNVETFSAAIKLLGERGVGYVHLMDGLGFGFHEKTEPFTLAMARDILKGTKAEETVLMGNVGYTKETAEARLQAGEADMIAFGRPYISNPDLAVRFAKNAPLNEDAPYEAWWSSHGAKMYTDYPAMQA